MKKLFDNGYTILLIFLAIGLLDGIIEQLW